MTLVYRHITTHDEYRALEELQRQIWGSDERDIVPTHLALTAGKNGGLAYAAFDTTLSPPHDMIGFVFGFLGFTSDRRLKHCSHMLGVLPAYRDRRIGAELKRRQRDFVLAQGVDLMTWTYDPLESRNARLNIANLGAVCRTYMPNLYGDMNDGLNAGLPSDRFEVEWHLNSAHVIARLADSTRQPALAELLNQGVMILNPAARTTEHDPAAFCQPPDGARVLIRFPANFQALKTAQPTAALPWRMQVRQLCETCFAAGYTVVDVLTKGAHSYYLLQQNWSPA